MKKHRGAIFVLLFTFLLLITFHLQGEDPAWREIHTGYLEGKTAYLYGTFGGNMNFAFADADNDGDMDMLRGQTELCQYFRNDGTPDTPYWTLSDPNPFNLNTTDSQNQTFPATGDLNRDGLLDVLIGVHEGNIRYYLNIGTPEQPEWKLEAFNVLPKPGARDIIPALVDIDNDGDLDLFTGGNPRGQCRINFFENIGLNGNTPVFEFRSG